MLASLRRCTVVSAPRQTLLASTGAAAVVLPKEHVTSPSSSSVSPQMSASLSASSSVLFLSRRRQCKSAAASEEKGHPSSPIHAISPSSPTRTQSLHASSSSSSSFTPFALTSFATVCGGCATGGVGLSDGGGGYIGGVNNSCNSFLRPSRVLCAPIYCKIIDACRESDLQLTTGRGHNVAIELGEGVTEMSVHALQLHIDEQLRQHSRFGTVRTGRVYDQRNRLVEGKVKAGLKYIITGNLRGGYMKPDARFGPRLTGYNGATTKPGLRWNGDEL